MKYFNAYMKILDCIIFNGKMFSSKNKRADKDSWVKWKIFLNTESLSESNLDVL